MRVSRWAWVALIVVIVALGGVAFQHRWRVESIVRHVVFGGQTPPRPHINVGDRLPAIDFVNLIGVRSDVEPEPGHLLFLNVFTTWCPDCIIETPALARLRKAMLGKPVDIIGIDQEEAASTVLSFSEKTGLDYPMYIDDQHVTEAKLGVHYIPNTFLVDDRGVVLANIAGPLTYDQMKELVTLGLARVSKRGG